MAADFIIAMKQHIAEDESITEAKLVLAREAAEYARSIGPVREGDYVRGIQTVHVGASGVGVVFTDFKSIWIEYGTVDTPEFDVAARTVEHFRQ